MIESETFPTPFAEINLVLRMLAGSVQEVLGERLISLYLHGSLASGDFNPRRSDIDFLVVTDSELEHDILDQVIAMHHRINASGLFWAAHLEGSYIPAEALRRHDPQQASHPALRVDGSFDVDYHGSDWIIQRHIIREKGITLLGPDPRGLIEAVSSAEIRQAQLGILREWWQPMLSSPTLLKSREYQVYAALTMCRALFTLQYGETTSKTASAAWVINTLAPRWAGLIESALAWPDGSQPDQLTTTLELIGYTLQQAEEIMASLNG